MIIIMTTIEDGGILQLSNQIAKTLKTLGNECYLYVPKNSKKYCDSSLNNIIYEYTIPKTVNLFNKKIKELVRGIEKISPELVIMVDDSIKANLVMSRIKNKHIKKIMFVHDVTPHLQNFVLRSFLVEKIRSFYRVCTFSLVDRVVLLSKNSESKFVNKYKKYKDKKYILPLGAHVIMTDEQKPIELKEDIYSNFGLFFGRIDKYKGVDRLIDAYKMLMSKKNNLDQLVIAGKDITGNLNYEEEGILVINRYISDGEMIWLFKHCKYVVLPYYEASQSGVLPIAYKFGKPVIVSNIPGLRELVEEERTGLIFNDTDELVRQILKLDILLQGRIKSEYITEYYNKYYDWEKNLNKLLFEILQ